MKRPIVTTIAAILCAGVAAAAFGQAYPNKPIRIVAPFAPGGGTDLIARVAAQKLTEAMGQQAVVEDRKSTRLNSSHG